MDTLLTGEETWNFKVKVSKKYLFSSLFFSFQGLIFFVVITAPLDAKFSSLFQDKLVKGKKIFNKSTF